MFSQALCSWDIDYFCIQGPIQLASDVVLHSLASGADCCPGDSTTVTHLPSHLWTASPPAGHKTRDSACLVREEMVENSTNAQWQTVRQSRRRRTVGVQEGTWANVQRWPGIPGGRHVSRNLGSQQHQIPSQSWVLGHPDT